jgi:hypothetical protein
VLSKLATSLPEPHPPLSKVYWSNYFRITGQKLGLLPLNEVFKLYLAGLGDAPAHLFTRANWIFLIKAAAHAALPGRTVQWLRGQKHRLLGVR